MAYGPLEVEFDFSGSISSHIKDAAALCSFFAWLEDRASTGEEDEITASRKLTQFKAEMEHFKGLSFETISASGPNAAIFHYR